MNATSLEHKTIRPGSLAGYSYYHSDRRPVSPPRPDYAVANRAGLSTYRKTLVKAVVVVAVLGLGFVWLKPDAKPIVPQADQTAAAAPASATPAQPAAGAAPAKAAAVLPAATNHCAGNTLDHFILVNITQRHLWACDHATTVHDTPVITGMLAHASTMTPPGTYHIYAKTTDTTLTGTDETGSWNDPVKYWMPFLDNEHGSYGFHDATWRADSAFGNTDPNSTDASHGCVELPLAASAWLYDWAPVGTTLTIES